MSNFCISIPITFGILNVIAEPKYLQIEFPAESSEAARAILAEVFAAIAPSATVTVADQGV